MYVALGWIDTIILFLYAAVLVGMGIYFVRKNNTAEEFMVAARSIPAWAAGLAVMSTYTSSISYIATPGMAYSANWHPFIFSICIIPVAWVTCKYVIPYYRKMHIISVYEFLETKLGIWARVYASLSFLLFMVGRVAVILYLVSVLLNTFLPWNIVYVILGIGAITIVYTLLGGIEAVIWTDVMQSTIMIFGILVCAGILIAAVFTGPNPLIEHAYAANKFNLGSWDLRLTLQTNEAGEPNYFSRTIWVMLIYGITENLRNLIADQNYVQKYSSVATEEEAKRSIWIAMFIYIPLTAIFLFIGSTLFAYYATGAHPLPDFVTKGDHVFPYFIATQLPIIVKGLVIAAIVAAGMSTIDSALNCSATVSLLDFRKRFFSPSMTEQQNVFFLRMMTIVWGILGMGFALLMLQAESALNTWWKISGIFGGGILGLFLLALFSVQLSFWQGIITIAISVAVIAGATFPQLLPTTLQWLRVDSVIIGAVGTAALLIAGSLFAIVNSRSAGLETAPINSETHEKG